MSDEQRIFDPRKHLRQLRGRGGASDYLDVKWRIVWLRSEHPDATIISEHVELNERIAIFKATVTIPSGGAASDYGSETPADFGDYIEKASTKAIGRALALLGYGTQFAPEHDLDNDDGTPHVVDSPRERLQRPPPARPGPHRGDAAPHPSPAAAPARSRQAGAGGPPPDEPIPDDQFGWTEFWVWARSVGLPNHDALSEAAGQSTKSLQPAEIRRLVLAGSAS